MIPPKELEELYLKMFDAMWDFVMMAGKKYGLTPDRILAMVVSCYLTMLKDKLGMEIRRDIAVQAVNDSLTVYEKVLEEG